MTSTSAQTAANKSISGDQEEKKSAKQKNSSSLDRTLEAKIFAKTKKTISDLRFEESEWYKKYLTFKENFIKITEKVSKTGENSLAEEEKEWYNYYHYSFVGISISMSIFMKVICLLR